jgi:hypothetical protein
MQLGQIVLRLRQANTIFRNNVVGIVDRKDILQNTFSIIPVAFVVPENISNTSKNQLDSGINQLVIEDFSIVVVLDNDFSAKNKLGLVTYDRLHDIRADIWKAILGWQIDNNVYLISYNGGRLIELNSAYLLYEFRFNGR